VYFFGDGNDEAEVGLDHFGFGLERLGGKFAQAAEELEEIFMRHPDEFLQRLDFLPLGFHQMLLRAGFALIFRIGERAQAVLHFVVNVFGHERHFLDDLQLEAKFREQRPEFLIGPLERRQGAAASGPGMRLAPGIVFGIHLLIHFMDARNEPPQGAQVGVPTGHLFVEHHAVEPLARRIGQQFFRQRDVFLAGEAEAVNDFADFVLGGFDALGNFHLLLARQQGHLPHLLEIHPHRVVENIEPVGVLLVGFGGFDAVHLGLVHDFNFQRAEFRKKVVQSLRRGAVFRQGIVDVVIGQMSLFPREADQFLDYSGQLRVRTVLRRTVEQAGGFRMKLCGCGDAPSSFFQGQIPLGFTHLHF